MGWGAIVQRCKRPAAAAIAALACAWLIGPGAAFANNKRVDVPGAEAVLYEVSENMYLTDDQGNVVIPQNATRRQADAALYGWARVGNPLCPSAALVTNVRAETCSVTAAGVDNLSLVTGKGTVAGTFAVVVQDDNTADAPEYVVMNGKFSGDMDLSIRPLSRVVGTFALAGSAEAVRFCGTFRLPFSLAKSGKRDNPRRGVAAYYLADDGVTVFPVQKAEMSLDMPTVRLELKFGKNC